MNAYSNLSLSRDLECIGHTIKKHTLYTFYYNSKGYYFSVVNPDIPLKRKDIDDYELRVDACNALLRTGFTFPVAQRILNQVELKALNAAKKDSEQAQHLNHTFETKVEGLSF